MRPTAILLLLCACADPGPASFVVPLATVEPIDLPNSPILIDRAYVRDGLYSIEEWDHWAGAVHPGCSYVVIEAAAIPHRTDGRGRWGRLFWVGFHGGLSATTDHHTWATVGDTMYTDLGLASINRVSIYGMDADTLLVEGVDLRRHDRPFRAVMMWRREPSSSDFDGVDWGMSYKC